MRVNAFHTREILVAVVAYVLLLDKEEVSRRIPCTK